VRKQFSSGVYGVFWCCKYALPYLMRADNGAIVNLTTVASFRGQPSMPAYSMMKGAVNGLTRNIAVDYGPNIRCNGVVVGVTRGTDAVDYLLEQMGAEGQGLARAHVTRLGHANDIAAAVAFLASEDSAVTTGMFVFAEGGETVRMTLPDVEEAFAEGIPAYKS
jgi:7-alpha-hydroxysteroid dehydrogenase